MSEIAQAVGDAAKKAEQGLAQDFSKAYHSILKDTEEKTTQVAEHAAENEAKTVDDLGKSAEHAGTTPHDPHAPSGGGPSSSPGEGGGPEGGAGREQVQDPHDAGRTEDAVCGGGEPVDMATGRMYIDQVDASLPGSLPLLFTRNFESGYRAGRWMGRRWVCTFDERLEIDAEGVVHIRADRVTQAYPHPEPGEPVQASAGDRRLLGVDARGRLYTVTEPGTGLVREFTVQADGATALLTRVRDRSGRHYDLEYDGAGTPLAIQHSGGYRLLVTTDRDRITALLLAGAAPDGGDQELLRYAYGEDGNLTEVYNSSSLPMRFTYDAWDRVTSWTDRNNSRYWYVYDSRGRVVDEGGEDDSLRFTFHYGEPDPATGLRVHTETNALGYATRYHINDRHQVVAIVDPLGNATRYERDRFDRLLSETDPLGRTTRYEYDGAGDLTTVIRPDGERTTAEYAGELSLPTRIVEPGGAVLLRTYDEAGRRTSATDPLGAVTRYTYDERGHLSGIDHRTGGSSQVHCDAAGLPVLVSSPSGETTRYLRDAFGRVRRITDGLGHATSLDWTVEGHLARRTAQDGSTQLWSYDPEGNCLTHTDETGATTRSEYTHFETLSARTEPDGTRMSLRHDAHMQLVAATDARGRTWSYTYDAAGRLVQEQDFEGRETRYVRDAAGQIVGRTDPQGRRTEFSYDLLGRVIGKVHGGDRLTRFRYDPRGHLLQATNSDADIRRSVDALGNLLSETVNGRELRLTRDAVGRRLSRRTPGGNTSTWTYDATGRPAHLATPGGRLDFTFDARGYEVVREIDHRLQLSSSWDSSGRLAEQSMAVRLDEGGLSTLQARGYSYRADGSLQGVADQRSGEQAFELDEVGRVTAAHSQRRTERCAYDANGSPLYQHVTYHHDGCGRVIRREVAAADAGPPTAWVYTWDDADRLTDVETPDGSRWHYRYDAFGRRISKERVLPGGATAETTDFTWDSSTLVEQTTQADYLPGPHTLTWDHLGRHPLAQTEHLLVGDRTTRRFFAAMTDLVGTPTELFDVAGGKLAWRASSRIWGGTAWPAGADTYTPLRFPGQYFDPESRLHYNYHRYYDPETARYLSPDPLGLAPGPDPYAYVRNPHVWLDPLGLSPHPPGPGFIASADGVAVPKSAAEFEQGLQAAVDAGEPGFGTFATKSAGTGFELPDGSRVRIMQPQAGANGAGLRASFTNGSDAPISPFTGKPVQPPKGVQVPPNMTPKQFNKEYVRSRTHVELEP
ncbi:RHS repeat-associated core domain-containing protein [Streptacidiphilus melanogenes]|uniref:RHS repeat-associated core domain-containing protein n=1 Tax=Streptacidiphilus melanogenes TaxID=411235 RepID=UPI0006935AB8|nr:RHS repeat-associated core domain-containing protein [Streptacidiphilus melanogenes]